MSLKIHILPALSDNYIFILDYSDGSADVIDPGDADIVLEFLSKNQLTLKNIFSTHHHLDHVGGNKKLVDTTCANVFSYLGDKDRIPCANTFVKDGQIIKLKNLDIEVLHVPGHTSGHVAYYLSKQQCLFVGDVMFSLGCGRLFEGSAEDMHSSLTKLASLPEETLVYFAHEYTNVNFNFAKYVDSKNRELYDFKKNIDNKKITVPTNLRQEKILNPFLRTGSKKIREFLKMENASDVEVFKTLRIMKDNFSIA